MRKLFLGLLSIVSLNIFGQIGIAFNDAPKKGINIQHLDSIYIGALDSDSTKCAFYGKDNEITNAWIKMFQSLQDTLSHLNYKWEKPTASFNRVYFNNDGSVDFFFYKFKTEIDETKQTEFNRILNGFIKFYKFPMTSNVRFAQCGMIHYADSEQQDNKK